MRHWEGADPDQEETTVKRSEGMKPQVEEVKAPGIFRSAGTNGEEGEQGEEEVESRLVDKDAGGSCKQARVR